MQFDLKRLGLGQQLAGAGAVLLFIFFFFFDWYGVSVSGFSAGVNGWDAHTLLRWLVLLTIVLALASAYLSLTNTKLELPVSPSIILGAVAALTTILVAWRMIIDNPGPDAIIDVKFGAILGLLSLIMITAGAYLSMQADGVSVSEAGGQMRSAATSRMSKSESAPPPAATPPPATPPDAPSESSPTGS